MKIEIYQIEKNKEDKIMNLKGIVKIAVFSVIWVCINNGLVF